jgi:serine/threonine protein kinase
MNVFDFFICSFRGGEMFDQLCSRGAYSEADAARLIREVASALAFLHGIGIVHGDMKPENIMLSTENLSNQVVKLVDFGCAVVFADDSPYGGHGRAVAVTPAYSPPEVLADKSNEDLDPSFDMWALGIIIYIMLTGVHPFDLFGKNSDEEIEAAILGGKKPPLRGAALTSHLSPDAIDLIEKLMEREPKKRLTAHQLLENPWVRGETARTSKIADSDKRLSAYKAFRTKLEAKVFADLVSFSDSADVNEVMKRTSLIERAFQKLDPNHRGYVTTNDLHRLTNNEVKAKESPFASFRGSKDDPLCLSGFSDLLAENMKNRYFPKGHIVYHEGDIGNKMYFINSGTVEVYTHDGANRSLRRAGDFFGEGALMNPKRIRSASIRCVTPVHAIEISREYFEKYLASEEGMKVHLREKDRSRKRQRAKTLLRLQQNMRERNLRKGDFLFQRGEEGNEMYIIEEGQAELLVGAHRLETLNPGDLTGEHSLIFGRPRNVSARCMSDKCVIRALRARDFYDLLDAHPTFKDSVYEICLRREFMKALCYKINRPFPKKEAELRAAFDAAANQSTGMIDLDEIRSMLKAFDPTYSERDILDILKSIDLANDGAVSWETFKRIFSMSNDSTVASANKNVDSEDEDDHPLLQHAYA